MKQKGLKILHQNVRGLLCNLQLLQKFLYTHQNTDIFCCSETHIKDNENIHDLYKVEGYDFVSRNRTTGKGGELESTLKRESNGNEDLTTNINQQNVYGWKFFLNIQNRFS